MKGQIVKIISNLYTVSSNNKIYECHSRGKFRKDNITPVVGDYVIFDEKENYILEIQKRKNSLVRPLVANIDQAFIITSVKIPMFSTNLLDKLLIVIEHNNIKPVICLTKIDLLTKEEKKNIKKYIKYYKSLGYVVLTNKNLFKIKRMFRGKTTVFTGQTGAGKSTLLNKLDKKLSLETGEISKALGRGKHTTRFVELHELYGGKVLDTPGFSMIDLRDLTDEDIRDSFKEFKKYNCPFRDCYHINEKECNVKKAITDDEILKERYENYIKFINKR